MRQNQRPTPRLSSSHTRGRAEARRVAVPESHQSHSGHPLLALQRQLGNRHVQQLLAAAHRPAQLPQPIQRLLAPIYGKSSINSLVGLMKKAGERDTINKLITEYNQQEGQANDKESHEENLKRLQKILSKLKDWQESLKKKEGNLIENPNNIFGKISNQFTYSKGKDELGNKMISINAHIIDVELTIKALEKHIQNNPNKQFSGTAEVDSEWQTAKKLGDYRSGGNRERYKRAIGLQKQESSSNEPLSSQDQKMTSVGESSQQQEQEQKVSLNPKIVEMQKCLKNGESYKFNDQYLIWTGAPMPGDEGWKIHVSVEQDKLIEAMQVLAGELQKYKIEHKFGVTEMKEYQPGKAIVVYPDLSKNAPQTFLSVVKIIDSALDGCDAGKAPDGDLQVGKHCYTRYGGFTFKDPLRKLRYRPANVKNIVTG